MASMKFPQHVNVAVCTLSASVFFVLACNLRFWHVFIGATGGFLWHNIPLYLGSFFIIVLILNALLTLFAFRWVLKPLLIFLFMATAFAAHFMSKFGAVID